MRNRSLELLTRNHSYATQLRQICPTTTAEGREGADQWAHVLTFAVSPATPEILACEPTQLGLLCLRRRELLSRPGTIVTEVTLNHEFLMSSYITASERALARHAIDMHPRGDLSVLMMSTTGSLGRRRRSTISSSWTSTTLPSSASGAATPTFTLRAGFGGI